MPKSFSVLKLKGYVLAAEGIGGKLYPCRLKHHLGCHNTVGFGILVAGVDYFLNSRLNYSLSTFVAREKGCVKAAALQGATAEIKNRVKLGMADKIIFSL